MFENSLAAFVVMWNQKMNLELTNIGKRYRFEWIFRELTYQFKMGTGYAILGNNGSGKSTFMQILSGHLSPSKGKLVYSKNDKMISIDEAYKLSLIHI